MVDLAERWQDTVPAPPPFKYPQNMNQNMPNTLFARMFGFICWSSKEV